jgi:AcrR family transcriptional regulator
MARWEPDARQRLERAALELFVERGYDATTVNDIAERAGLTKSTFFRQFADKRDVLSGGQELLTDAFRNAISSAPASATIVDCLAGALDVIAPVFTPERHELAQQRRTVIAANSELQERELLKRAHLAAAIAEAFRARGIDEIAARLAGEMGVLAFSTSFARWSAAGKPQAFARIARTTLHELQARAQAL